MSKTLSISKLGHPVLREKAHKVNDLSHDSIQELIDDMIATIKEVNGVGIAAPQVFVSKQIFIVASHPSKRYPNAPNMEPTAMINPKILELAGEIENDWEGCLSIPELRGIVPRHHQVTIEYTTRENKRLVKTFEGFIARIIQHEYDHLQGIFFTDRVASNHDLYAEEEYQRIIKSSK